MARQQRITYRSSSPPRVTIRQAVPTTGYPAKTRRNGLDISSSGEELDRGLFDWEQPPGDEPGTLADVMDGTAQQDVKQEEDQKLY